MARKTTSIDVNNRLEFTPIVSSYPLTMACWCRVDVDAAAQGVMGLGRASSALSCMIWARTDIPGKPFQMLIRDSSYITALVEIGNLTISQWYHVALIWVSQSIVRGFFNGNSGEGNNPSIAVTQTFTHGAIFCSYFTTYMVGFCGAIAEAGIWNVALTDDEVVSLARGASPMLVRPQSLKHYWPLYGNTSPEIDRCGNSHATVVGTVPSEPHHRIFYRGNRNRSVFVPQAAPPPNLIPIFQHHYRQMEMV